MAITPAQIISSMKGGPGSGPRKGEGPDKSGKYSKDAIDSGFKFGSKDWQIYMKQRSSGNSHSDALAAIRRGN